MNCQDKIELIISNSIPSTNPFAESIEDSGISREDCTLLETYGQWYLVVQGIWGFNIDWFPKGTELNVLSNGIVFSKRK